MSDKTFAFSAHDTHDIAFIQCKNFDRENLHIANKLLEISFFVEIEGVIGSLILCLFSIQKDLISQQVHKGTA